MLLEVDSALHGLVSCRLDVEVGATLVLMSFFVRSQLDEKTQREWDYLVTDRTKYPSYQDLKLFLLSCLDSTSQISSRSLPTGAVPTKKATSPMVKKSFSISTNDCHCCHKEWHLLIQCPSFQSKTLAQRFEVVKKARICINCFGTQHIAADCMRGACKECGKKRHTLLHSQANPNPKPDSTAKTSSADTTEAATKPTTTVSCSTAMSEKFVLLPTAIVNFQCGKSFGRLRVLFDSASQISDQVVRQFHLQVYPSTLSKFKEWDEMSSLASPVALYFFLGTLLSSSRSKLL